MMMTITALGRRPAWTHASTRRLHNIHTRSE